MISCRRFLIGLVAATLLSGTAFALTGEKYLPDAKVTLAQARATALKTYPGKIVSEELEQESGGSGLRYSFVVRHHATSTKSESTRRPALCSRTRSRARIPTRSCAAYTPELPWVAMRLQL